MKKIILSNLLAFSLLGPLQTALAVEYVTLSTSSKTVTVAPSSLVEVVGYLYGNGNNFNVEFTLANGDISSKSVSRDDAPATEQTNLNHKFTNVSQVRLYRSDNSADLEGGGVTLKITPSDEIESAGPKTVMVIPEGSTGDFDVVIESSGDLVTWTPMHSQTVSGSGPKTFFRTRIVKR